MGKAQQLTITKTIIRKTIKMLTTKTAQLFTKAMTALVEESRKAYDAHHISQFNFSATVSGRTTGDLSVTFKFSENSYGYNDAASHNPIQALKEVLRRHGWVKENTSLVLTYSGDEKVSIAEETDQIPF